MMPTAVRNFPTAIDSHRQPPLVAARAARHAIDTGPLGVRRNMGRNKQPLSSRFSGANANSCVKALRTYRGEN